MQLSTFFYSLAITGVTLISASAHCQIPCGIYDDEARFGLLAEHITTIEKSIEEINVLSSKETLTAQDQNQLVRWVANKEAHADDFAKIVTQYFLQQRIKPVEGDAKISDEQAMQLSLLHKLLVGAMKCKQNPDSSTTESLKETLAAFKKSYNAQ